MIHLANDGKISGADEFLPLLILVVLHCNPRDLHTNVEYISYFRSPTKMGTEAGYYFTNLVSSVAFIRELDHTKLSGITKEEFQK